MTVTAAAFPTSLSTSFSSRATLASGVIGMVASGLLIAADQLRAWRLASRPVFMYLFTSHDAASIFQSLLLIPVALALYTLCRRRSPVASVASVTAGVTGLCAIAMLQSLRFVSIGPETLYMLPQGLVGVWLIVVNWRLSNTFPAHVTRTGIIAGVGLIMIAASLLGVIGYFGMGILSGVPPANDPQARLVNRVLHYNLDAGTWLGKPLYPIWALLIARRLNSSASD
jgi:hypothetical protein